MKKGFTMIELIFVIVILGILAAVAIPRLAATRDDAGIAKALSEVTTMVADIGAAYTAQGSFAGVDANNSTITSTEMSSMTNVASVGTFAAGNTFAYRTPKNDGTDEDCILFQLFTDGNMTISENNTSTGNICAGLKGSNAYGDLAKAQSFGGKKVVF